jgi:hypothetical protein
MGGKDGFNPVTTLESMKLPPEARVALELPSRHSLLLPARSVK